MEDGEARALAARIETLLQQLESIADPAVASTVTETVQALLGLYGEGLARIVELAAGRGGDDLLSAFAADEVVSHLLLLHGLHPRSLEERVLQALDEVRPYLESHGGDVTLLGVEDGVARLRLQGSCHGCPSSAATLELAIEEAIGRTAPDLERLDVEGVAPAPVPQPLLFVDGPAAEPPAPADRSAWAVPGGLPQLAGGGLLLKEVAGEPLVFLRVDDSFYAYRHRCPGCGASLGDGKFEAGALTCCGCGRGYDVRLHGACRGDPRLSLDPVPLLVGREGLVRVALGATR